MSISRTRVLFSIGFLLMLIFYLKVISAGTCVSFATDATSQPYMSENAAMFSLATISMPIMFFVTYKYAKDTQYYKEENVVVPIHVRKEIGFLERDVAEIEMMKAGACETAKNVDKQATHVSK